MTNLNVLYGKRCQKRWDTVINNFKKLCRKNSKILISFTSLFCPVFTESSWISSSWSLLTMAESILDCEQNIRRAYIIRCVSLPYKIVFYYQVWFDCIESWLMNLSERLTSLINGRSTLMSHFFPADRRVRDSVETHVCDSLYSWTLDFHSLQIW